MVQMVQNGTLYHLYHFIRKWYKWCKMVQMHHFHHFPMYHFLRKWYKMVQMLQMVQMMHLYHCVAFPWQMVHVYHFLVNGVEQSTCRPRDATPAAAIMLSRQTTSLPPTERKITASVFGKGVPGEIPAPRLASPAAIPPAGLASISIPYHCKMRNQ